MEFLHTQYEQLSQDVRNFEVRLYLTPLALLTILGVTLQYTFGRPDDLPKVGLSWLLVIISHALTCYFAKTSIHQRELKRILGEIEKINETEKSENKDSLLVGRSTSNDSQGAQISRDMYKKYTPLWLYFYRSADAAIMYVMITCIIGTAFYAVKTTFDMVKVIPEECASWLPIMISIVVIIIYFAVISKSSENDTDQNNKNNDINNNA